MRSAVGSCLWAGRSGCGGTLAGEAAQTLAARSRDVYRVTGGLAQVLKGGER